MISLETKISRGAFHIGIVLGLILINCCAFSQFGSGNLLDIAAGDGDFETSLPGTNFGESWSNWNSYPTNPMQLSLDNTTAYTGSQSQKFRVASSGIGSVYLTFNQNFGTSGITNYQQTFTVSYYSKTSANLSGVNWNVYIDFGNTLGSLGSVQGVPLTVMVPNTNWTKTTFTVTFPITASLATWWKLTFYAGTTGINSTGSIWVDNVSITNGQTVPSVISKPMKTFMMYNYTSGANWLQQFTKYDGGRWGANTPLQLYKKMRPDASHCMFCLATYVPMDSTFVTSDILIPYTWIIQNHPEWILINTAGVPLSDGYNVSLDIGNPTYQQEFLTRYLAMAHSLKMDTVMWDSLDIHAAHNLNAQTAMKYPTDASWQAAVGSFLDAVSVPLRNAGTKVMLNLAHCTSLNEPAKTWLTKCDGMMIEFGFINVDANLTYFPWPFNSWKSRVLSLSQTPPSETIYLKNDGSTITPLRRYGLASYFMGMANNDYYTQTIAGDYMDWHSDMEAPIGSALGDFTIVNGDFTNGGIFKRMFTNGMVLTNPHATATLSYNIPSAFHDLDGNVVGPGSITMAPLSGLILLGQPLPDTQPPTNTINFPANQSAQLGTISVVGNIADTSGISKVELYWDNTLVNVRYDAPYLLTVDSKLYPNGAHTLQLKAYDAYSNVSNSQSVTVNTANESIPPVVAIVPANNTVFNDDSTIQVNATDNAAVQKCELYVDGNLLQTAFGAGPLFNFTWIPSWYTPGPHVFVAKAYDTSNNMGVSAPVNLIDGMNILTGHVTLQGRPNIAGLRLYLNWRVPGTHNYVKNDFVALDANGNYTIHAPSGIEDLDVKMNMSLRAIKTNFNFSVSGTSTIDWNLINGDTNNDNHIDDTDLLNVINDYMKPTPTHGYTDVNGDGIVNDTDLLLIINNFLMNGVS